jgi:hypothetical protein
MHRVFLDIKYSSGNKYVRSFHGHRHRTDKLISFTSSDVQGPFGKFVDSPYYSESELCGVAVTVFFAVPPLASDALLTTLHPLLENVLQSVDHFEISFLRAPFHV